MASFVVKKSIRRSGWSRVKQSKFYWVDVNMRGFTGVAAILELQKVDTPLWVTCCEEFIKIVDDGFYWLQLAPKDANWWLTVMLDRECKIVQYYVDITRKNVIDGENSWFEDLMLDVAALPNGYSDLLDEEELDAALEAGEITREEAELARETAQKVRDGIWDQYKELQSFCMQIFCLMRPLPVPEHYRAEEEKRLDYLYDSDGGVWIPGER